MNVPAFEHILPLDLGLPGGAMIRIVGPEHIPDAPDTVLGLTVAVVSTLSFAALFALQHFMLHAWPHVRTALFYALLFSFTPSSSRP